MADLQPDMSVSTPSKLQPEFNEEIWQYLNRRVSDWRIQTGKQKLKEHGALLARMRRTRRLASPAVGIVGGRIRLRRSRRAEDSMRPIFPSLRRSPGASRAGALLGTGVDQRAAHRRARLVDAGRDARLLGRRHGPHPVDAGGLAQCRPGLRRRRPRLAVRPARRRAGIDRAVSAQARQVAPGRALGLRGEGGASAAAASKSYAAWQKAGIARADGAPSLGARELWVPEPGGPASCSVRISVRCAATTRRTTTRSRSCISPT